MNLGSRKERQMQFKAYGCQTRTRMEQPFKAYSTVAVGCQPTVLGTARDRQLKAYGGCRLPTYRTRNSQG